ncbi:hypothetical protein JCM11641_005030 [Rhodosporidiobolus odoratus]
MFAARQSLRIATRVQRTSPVATFSSSALRSSEGAPSGSSSDSFSKREKAQEEAYVRDSEREKLKALRKSIEASQAHLAELKKQHDSLESSIGPEGAKSHLASKLAAAQAAGQAATPGYGGAAPSNPYGPPPTTQPASGHAASAFPGQPPSQTSYGQQQAFGAHAPQSSPYGAPQQSHGQQQNQYAPPGAPPPVPSGRPGQLPYPGAPQQQQGQGQYGQQQGQYGQQQQGQYGQQQGYGGPPPQYGQPIQQQQYGAAGGAGPGGNSQTILQVLADCVRDQNISAFYPPGSLEPIAARIAQSGALARIAQDMRLPMEIAIDLAKLSLFDVVLYIDDSGSMAFEENGSRIDDAKLVVSKVATVASAFDTDGINVRFMNSRLEGNNVTSEQQASQLISQIKFSGVANILRTAALLRSELDVALDTKILQPMIVGPANANALRKPVLIIGVTDGAPGGEDRNTLARVIKRTKDALSRTRYGPDTLSVQLAQIGNDMGARAFLEEIDNHPEIGGFVDCTSNYEQEADDFARSGGGELTPELWLVKLMLGACDSSYDLKDERR